MKIVHITFSLLNGGKENLLVDLADEQVKLGHQVSILVINNKLDFCLKSRINENVLLKCLYKKNFNFLWVVKLFIFLIVKADVIHAHDASIGKALRYLPKRKILTIHTNKPVSKYLKYFDAYVAVSYSVKKYVENLSNVKCSVIYNGIKCQEIMPKKVFLNTKTQIINILIVGRLDHHIKGQDILILAANEIINKKNFKGFKFYFMGDGNSKDYLISMIKSFQLESYCEFLGLVDRENLYANLCKYDILVLPSRTESFGLSMIEAMCAGLPVAASKLEGPKEILSDGQFGFLFEPDNCVDLANKIIEAYDLLLSPNIKEYLARNRDYCLNNFSISIIAQKYISIYEEVSSK